MFKKIFLVLVMSIPLSAYADGPNTHGSFNFHGGSLPINSETTITVDGVSYSIGSLITDINQAMTTLSGIDAQISQIETTSNTAYNVAAAASSNAQNSMNIASSAIPKTWIDANSTENITGIPSLNANGYIHTPLDETTIVNGSGTTFNGETILNVLEAIDKNTNSISSIQGNISGDNSTVVLKSQIGSNNGVAGLNSTGAYSGVLENNKRTGGTDTGTDISAANLSSSMTGTQAVAAITALQNNQENLVTNTSLGTTLANYITSSDADAKFLPLTGGVISNGLDVHGSLNSYTNMTIMNGYHQTFWPQSTGVLGVNILASSSPYGLLQINDTGGGSGGILTGSGTFSGAITAKSITGDISGANLSSSMTGTQAVAAITSATSTANTAQTTANNNATTIAATQVVASNAIPKSWRGANTTSTVLGVAPLDADGNSTAPVWSASVTSAPSVSSGQQPLFNAGRFPVVSTLASDVDPFQSPDSFYIGGLPTSGWSTSGAAANQVSRPGSLVVTGQPWGPYNAGALESILMSQGVDSQNGVCASDWRSGPGSYCGADGVGQYIGVTNVEALIVGEVSSFTASSVVLKTALTSDQIAKLRVGMYISTNIVNDTTVPTAATDSWGNTKIANVNYYLAIVSGWSSDGTTIYVSGWDIPWGGSHASGQIPQTITGDAIDKINSNYGAPVVFIGNPDNGSAHNEYLDYKGYNAGDVSGVYSLASAIVSGSSTITVNGTPETVSGYDTNIEGAGIASGTTVTDISTTDGVSTLTLSTPTTSDEPVLNHSVTIFSSGVKDGTTLARMLTGDEIDLKYWATRTNEVHLDGITIGVSADSGSPLGRTALTQDSYMLSLSGDIHNLLILDGPSDGNIIEGHSFYLHGQEGVSTVNGDDRTVQTLFGFTGEVDGNSAYNLMGWEKKDLPDTNGINGASFHLGIVDNGYANTLDPSQNGAGEIVWNHNGANIGGISLCGASACGLDMASSGIMTTNKQLNAGGAIAMTAGNQLQFIPSDNDGYSYWYAPPAVSGLTLSAKTYQGGDASITGYNGTFSGALSATGAVSGAAATFASVTASGAIFGKSGVQVGNGQNLILYPSTTGTYPYEYADSAAGITLKSSAGGDVSLSGIYNLASSGTAAFTGSLVIPFGTPTSSTATCTEGQIQDDADYHYVCVATNTWKRVALTTW